MQMYKAVTLFSSLCLGVSLFHAQAASVEEKITSEPLLSSRSLINFYPAKPLLGRTFTTPAKFTTPVEIFTKTTDGPSGSADTLKTNNSEKKPTSHFAGAVNTGKTNSLKSLTVTNGSQPIHDIDAPKLTIHSPAADTIVDAGTVNVTGLVTDNINVESLTVNGVFATLISTNNPDDPNERSFNVSFPLASGENQMLIEAFDAQENRAAKGQDVFQDSSTPTVVWMPADNTITTHQNASTLIDIIGSANDDTGIQSITLDGESLVLTSTNNIEFPNEVSFGSAVYLENGINSIEIIVADISGRQVTQVHRIEVIESHIPTADIVDNRPSEITSVEVTQQLKL